ncbi:MAG: hypothetical protein JOY56_03695 [Solirubrobacterales bacterium]|nr:hypothetical protein [Solirubrobacterales bacterium]
MTQSGGRKPDSLVADNRAISAEGAGGQLIASDPTLDNFCLQLHSTPDGQGVVVQYTGIPGNQPESYHNSVALWDSWSPVIDGPNKTPPLVVVPISGNLQPSTVFVPWPFTGTDYLITYQVGDSLTTMCAALELSLKLKVPVPPTAISLSVSQLDATSITIVYNTLGGYLPKTYGNWVGVWQGFSGPYFAPTPDSWAPAGSDHTQDVLTVSNLRIIAGFDYRIIYFMGPQADGVPGSNIGAVLTFKATEALAP